MTKEKQRQISKVAIIGGKGRIGSVLQKGLKGFQIETLDFPEFEVRNYGELVKKITGFDALIHLAWNPNIEQIRESAWTTDYDSDNSLMTFNIYKAAMESEVRRVIMASSVHADSYLKYKGKESLIVDSIPTPDSPYGANKIFMEALGRYYSKKGLEVICVRFGGVNLENKPPKDKPFEFPVWLYHEDLWSMINACLKAETVPNNFSVFYAISNNKGRIHDTSNPFGWKPK